MGLLGPILRHFGSFWVQKRKNSPKNFKKSPKIRKNTYCDKKIIRIYFGPFWTHFDPFWVQKSKDSTKNLKESQKNSKLHTLIKIWKKYFLVLFRPISNNYEPSTLVFKCLKIFSKVLKCFKRFFKTSKKLK